MKTLGIYVPSYNRPDAIITAKAVPSATYVVRKSQEEAYRQGGVQNILAVDDDQINSWAKVMTYIYTQTPEDVVVTLDDDITHFVYRTKENHRIENPQIVEDELVRISQLVSDLKIGYGSLTFTPSPWSYTGEFRFSGNAGSVFFFNKEHVKGKYDPKAGAYADTDFQLQELLSNRITLIPQYLVAVAKLNKGRDTQARDSSVAIASAEYMKAKWGRYYSYNEKTRKTKVNVER